MDVKELWSEYEDERWKKVPINHLGHAWKKTMLWVLLVDCVRVSEFDHGFVYVFACLDAKKMK